MIPRRIIQTGKNRDLPLIEKAATNGIRLLHPDYEYLFFDDEEVEKFVDTEFPEHRELFDSFPYRIQKYDFFRYLAVFRLGGFYFDLDVLLAKNLDPLLQFDCVFPFEEISIHAYLREQHSMDWEIGNYAFGASAGHPFLKAIIENCIRAQQDRAWAARMWEPMPHWCREQYFVLDTTGPGLVTRTLAEIRNANACPRVLFPVDVRDAEGWHHFGDYGTHLQAGGWRTKGSRWKKRLVAMWEVRTRQKYMIESQRLGPARQLQCPF